MDTPGIYCYWEGDRRHWYFDLCWETIRRWNPTATLLGRADVEAVIGRIPPVLDEVYVVHRVDWLRKEFIRHRGGLWLDMDFICWSDLRPLAQAGAALDFLGWREWHNTGWMDNFFAARAGSPILEEAADYALKQIERWGKDVPWLATNAHAMNAAMAKHAWGLWMQIPTHLVGPVSVMDVRWFISDQGSDDVRDFHSLGFMTSMHGIGDWLNNVGSADRLMAGRSHLAALLRRALE